MKSIRRCVSPAGFGTHLRGAGIVLCGLFLGCLFGTPRAFAQGVRTQTIHLTSGWNAVYMEVDPSPAAPAALFAEHPVDMVAAYAAPGSDAQFVRDPRADLLRAYGWAVWYAPVRADAFLTTLYGIHGARGYLVHATTNATLTVAGTAPPERLSWTPDAFNFVGFAVLEQGAPTFAQFFAGSPAHAHNRIYRLVGGSWRQVLDPAAAVMNAGEAFWIYCDGRSDYRGPLDARASSVQGLILAEGGRAEIVVRNRTGHPVAFAIEHVVDPQRPIPLSSPVESLDEAAGGGLQELYVHLAAEGWRQQFPPLEAGKALRFPLALRAREMEPGTRESLLKVVSDMGTIDWIPLTATRAGQ